MHVNWRKHGNQLYANLETTYYDNGKVKRRHIAYLGRDPVKKLKELIAAGKITKEEAVQIKLNPRQENEGLRQYLEELKKELDSRRCEGCPYKRDREELGPSAREMAMDLAYKYGKIKGIINLYGDDPAKAIEQIRGVING